MSNLLRLLPFLCAAPLAACASQVDSSHQGNVLAKIAGTVRNQRTQPTDDAEVVVLWDNSSGPHDFVGVESTEVTGSFPAQFHLSIYQPPDDTLLNNYQGVKVGVAFIAAGVPGTDYTNDSGAGVLGLEVNHLLVYLPQAIPAGSFPSYLLRGTPAPGFHLYGVHKLTDQEQATRQACIAQLPEQTAAAIYTQCGGNIFDDFVPLESDLATPLEIDLIDDINTIDPPNWT